MGGRKCVMGFMAFSSRMLFSAGMGTMMGDVLQRQETQLQLLQLLGHGFCF